MESYMHYKIVQDLMEENHFHPEMEAVYIIRGNVKAGVMNTEYQLYKGDVFIIPPGLEHFLNGSDGSIVCCVSYPEIVLSSVFGAADNLLFFCRKDVDSVHSYEKIRSIFYDIILEYMKQEKRSICMERSLLYRLLACLLEEFMTSETNEDFGNSGNSIRLQKITAYMARNFSGNITLTDLAHKMYTSSSSLSRFFKKQTGIYFSDYLNQLRLRYAAQGLLYTEDNVTKIAVDSGFSNLSVFNRLFRKKYGMSPTEYRKQVSKEPLNERHEKNDLIEKLRDEFTEEISQNKDKEYMLRAEVDVLQERNKYKKVWNTAINVGSLNTILLANTQYHILFLTENLGYKYVRLWNIFSTQMMVTDGIHSENFNFDQVDIAFDFLISHKLIPFLDFGVRPKTAVYDAGNYIYYGNESVEFCSKEVWQKAVYSLIRHFVDRYGKEDVSRWIFEMSYDMAHNMQCYRAEDYSYFETYQFLYHTVKAIIPEAEVGGPMAVTYSQKEFIRKFLKSSREQKCIPDFISITLFPHIEERKKDKFRYSRPAEDSYEKEEIRKIRSLIRNEGMSCRLYIVEWNYTISSRDYLNDSCFRASYYISKIVELWKQTDMMVIWMASDWISNYFDVHGVANGGNGLLTKDTICKPAYYALQFLNTAGEYLIAKGKNYLITGNENNDYYILLFHYEPLRADYYFNARTDDPRRLAEIYEQSHPLDIDILLRPMRGERYVVKCRKISPEDGSLLREWEKFDFDSSLSSQEVKYIRQICFPRVSMKKQKAEEGSLDIRDQIGLNEIKLIHIYEEKKF